MSDSLRSDYISCPVCGKSVEYRIYNKHWAQSRGHRTDQNPYPPPIQRPSRPEHVVDSIAIEMNDGNAFVNPNDVSLIEYELEVPDDRGQTPSDREMEIERIEGAGTAHSENYL